MRARRASTTAQLVAFWRALADRGVSVVPGFTDPYAQRVLRGGWSWALRLTTSAVTRMPPEGQARFAAGMGAIPLRGAFIDERVTTAVAAGARQLVILGAGLDTRAWRLPALAGVPVFEVDHPATQSLKRSRVESFPSPVGPLRFVAVDFARDALGPALAAAGHRADRATAWLWEGVVMYLGDDALRSTLSAVRARSASGSVLLLHYHEPSVTDGSRWWRRAFFSALGEPQIGARSRDAIRQELEQADFALVEDAGADEQAAALGAESPTNDVARISRVCVARVGQGP